MLGKRYANTTKSGYFSNIKTIHLGFLNIFISLKSIFLCLLDVKKNNLNIRQDFFDKRFNIIFLLYYLRTQYVSNLKAFEILIQIFGELLPKLIDKTNKQFKQFNFSQKSFKDLIFKLIPCFIRKDIHETKYDIRAEDFDTTQENNTSYMKQFFGYKDNVNFLEKVFKNTFMLPKKFYTILDNVFRFLNSRQANTNEVKFLETKIVKEDDENVIHVQTSFKSHLNGIQTLFKNNSEKYEYLIIHNPQDEWIEKFKQTKEYKLLYEENICEND